MCLNIWGGCRGPEFFDYLKQLAPQTDFFCFQEVFRSSQSAQGRDFVGHPQVWSELKECLRGHKGFFEMTSKNHDLIKPIDFDVESGQAIFVKKNFQVKSFDCTGIYGKKGESFNPSVTNLPTALQSVQVAIGGKNLSIYNFHGIAYPGDKLDTPERVSQSEEILKSVSKVSEPKILCGDFNLMPETQSINILGQTMKDLIKEFKIENTRNEISWGMYNNKQYFADFTFVSPDIIVENFKVPYNLVSDHLPMILEFSL